MRSYLFPAVVLLGGGAAVYFLTRPSSSSTSGEPVAPATGAQEPEITIPGVGGVTIPGLPWYVRSAADVRTLIDLEARKLAAGGKLNTRPRATCAGGSCA